MSKYIIPAGLLIVFVILAIMFFPSSEETLIHDMIKECETNLNNKQVDSIIPHLDKSFIVPDFELNYDSLTTTRFRNQIAMLGNVDVRKIDIEIDEDVAKANMIVRVTNKSLGYESPFEVSAELKKVDETWLFRILNIKPYKLQQ